MRTVASLHATPRTVNCVAEIADREPHPAKEMPVPRMHETRTGMAAKGLMVALETAVLTEPAGSVEVRKPRSPAMS